MENDDSMLGSGVRNLKGFRPNRRAVLKGAMASGAALLSAPAVLRAAAQDEIQVASMFDLTGNLNIYGVQQMNVSKYAIEAINEAGGVLGKKLVLNAYDTQSKIELYSRYAQEIGTNEQVAAVVACFTGASREAARPVLSRFKKLLFFPTIDEGGECDRFCFMQGTDCVQQEGPLIEWAAKNAGDTLYVVAADYVYGHVATAWTKALAEKAGVKISGIEFIPLEVSDFSSTIRKIQSAKPAAIMSNLVGSNHIAFYRQFAAAGLNGSIPIVSPVFGLGNEQEILSAEETKGIVVAYSYFETLESAENKTFLEGFRKVHPDSGVVADTPAQVWIAWHQWKQAVEKAGTTEIMPVVEALESGMSFTGPAGPVTVDAPCHRNIQDVHLARVDANQKFEIIEKFEQVKPTREVVGAGACDLTGADQNSHRMIEPKF
ncbi:MAG: transporter substrate-binding protein [Mesorhizobium sp.]